MVTLTDRQAVKMAAVFEKLLRSAPDNRTYNAIRVQLLTLKKKIRR